MQNTEDKEKLFCAFFQSILQIADVKKQNLIMGTRAQAFTAKIKNLQEIQMRLMQGSLPLPQGHEIANSLKYFR